MENINLSPSPSPENFNFTEQAKPKNLELDESIRSIGKRQIPTSIKEKTTTDPNKVIFEIVPPPLNWNPEEVSSYHKQVCNVLNGQGVKKISIPHVVEEERKEAGERTKPFDEKENPISFGKRLQEFVPSLDFVPFKVSVLAPKDEFHKWIKENYEQGLREVVIVGGESSEKVYSGYQVTEAVTYIKKNFPDMKVGAVTIFSRKQESERMLAKLKAGVDFFYSQILFEMEDAKDVLKQFFQKCQTEGLEFPDIYLSLAVASQVRDIKFMKWLGVKFPTDSFNYLIANENPTEVSNRTLEVTGKLIKEITSFADLEGIPIGFKVEPVMYENVELSQKLYEQILKFKF